VILQPDRRPRAGLPLQAAPPLAEDPFVDRVIDLAKRTGWLVTHFRPARTQRGYRTPIKGHKGFCDLVLARAGVVLIRECKTDKGTLSVEQRAWLAELGDLGGVWRPRDWDSVIVPTLTAPRRRS
jgi:hypothetical protein